MGCKSTRDAFSPPEFRRCDSLWMRRRAFELARRHYNQAREEDQPIENVRFYCEQMNLALNNLVEELCRENTQPVPVAEVAYT